MKKLMVAALAAGAMSVYADCGDVAKSCLVYDIKVTLKTLGPKDMKCKASNACGDSSSGTVAYADTVTRTLKGYAWTCDYGCDECTDATGTALSLALWEPKASLGWWLVKHDTDADGNTILAGVVDPLVIGDKTEGVKRYGKKGTKAALTFTRDAEGTSWINKCEEQDSEYLQKSSLQFSAVGGTVAYNKALRNCIVKSISGVVTGTATVDVRCDKNKKNGTTEKGWCGDSTTGYECCPNKVIFTTCLCNCDPDWCEAEEGDVYAKLDDAPVVGTWSMKYNASNSKGKATLASKLPKYVLAD